MSYDFKSETEVKEFLHNLGIEYRFGCYSEKKPDVCHLLGDYLEAVKKDFEKAAKVYKNNCDDHNYGKSCLKFGTYSLIGKGGVKRDYKSGYEYLSRACQENEPNACMQQGLMLISSTKEADLPNDPSKGMELLTKACEAENSKACYYLSTFFISGIKKQKDDGENEYTKTKPEYIVKRDMEKAFKYAEKACHLGNMYSCVNLSQMYTRGDGVEKDLEKGDKYKKISLEMQKEINSNQTLKFGEGLN